MVEKAKLDILEKLPDIEMADAVNQTEVRVEPLIPALGEKWALNKILLIVAPAFMVVLVIVGVLWFYLTRTDTEVAKLKSGTPVNLIENKKPEDAEKISKQTAAEPVKTKKIYFNNFFIDLKDKTGKSKILMCDVAVNVGESGNATELENRKDIRNLIYQTATGKNAIVLRSIEERKRLKNELLQELNKMLGDGIIKDVYFTNYLIL